MLTRQEQNLIEQLHVWGLPRTPGSKIIQSEGWFQVVSEDYKSPAFNEVLFSNCIESEIENKILETINFYKEVGTDFKWCVHPHSEPKSTAELLKKHNFLNWQSRMMFTRVAEFVPHYLSRDIEVHKVNASDMDAFIDLFIHCWKLNQNESELVRMQLLFDNQQQGACFERFIAFDKGAPAGVASMVRNSDCGYLHATAVLPEFQGRGLYRALVERRIDILRKEGAKLAITGAREKTSAPRLERLGFYTAWQVQMFLKRN